MGKRGEYGRGTLGCIFGLVIVAIMVMIGVKVIPAKVAVAEMKDTAERQAQNASLPRYGDEMIRDALFNKARELDLPVTREDIQVRRDGSQVYIDMEYRIVFDFPGYTYNWDVKQHVERILF